MLTMPGWMCTAWVDVHKPSNLGTHNLTGLKQQAPACAGAHSLAEAEGFEPPVPFGTPVFKTGAIDQLCQTSGTANLQEPCQLQA
ncbi:MAG: hypothetical protein RLZZ314_641 [Bacteroidota bacterium]